MSRATFPLVLTAAQMRAADRAATDRSGLPSLLLMENAGRGLAALVSRLSQPKTAPQVRIVCGAGANGGDGFVAARHLAIMGAEVRVLLALPRAKLTGDAAVNLTALAGMGGVTVEELASQTSGAAWSERLSGADVVVDALFGIGLSSDVIGVPATAIAAMNGASGIKVAADIPSGLDADTGQVRGVAFRADVTATMGARKLAMALDPSAPVGRVEVMDLGVPLSAEALGPICRWLQADAVASCLPRRGASSHKGSAGHLFCIAGSVGKTGAAVLTGFAALRAGAGLVTLASTGAGQRALDAKIVEVMSARYSDGDDADQDSAAVIRSLAKGARAVAIGPGIPTGTGMAAVVRDLVGALPLPMVVDADALNLLGRQLTAVVRAAPAARVLTPHPGEMARLLGLSVAEVQAARLVAARRLAADSGAVVVLKGARTLIAAADGAVYVNPTASPSLATAGSGDVLTGVVGALLAQGLDALDAATSAVFIHGAAGELAAQRLGSGVIAGDLPALIAEIMTRLLAAPGG